MMSDSIDDALDNDEAEDEIEDLTNQVALLVRDSRLNQNIFFMIAESTGQKHCSSKIKCFRFLAFLTFFSKFVYLS